MIDEADQTIHILFEISAARSIPADAPLIAIRSGFLTKRNTGKVMVIGTNAFPQMLAGVASRVTNKDIQFFPDQATALDYLQRE